MLSYSIQHKQFGQIFRETFIVNSELGVIKNNRRSCTVDKLSRLKILSIRKFHNLKWRFCNGITFGDVIQVNLVADMLTMSAMFLLLLYSILQ